MVTLIAALPVSIALMNTGLAMAWIGALLCRAPVHRTVGFWCGVAYAFWQGVSRLCGFIDGRDVSGGWGMMYTWTGLCLAQVAFAGSDPTVLRARHWAFRLLAVSTALACLVALGQFVIGHQGSARPLRIHPDGVRFVHSTGFFAIHLTFGVVMMLILLAWAGDAFRSWVTWGRWRWVSMSCAGFGMLLSMGRLAFVGIAAGVAAGIAARGRRFLWFAMGMAMCILMLVGGILALVQPERFQATLRGEDGRWPIWRTSVAIIQEHPLAGVGSSREFKSAYRDHYTVVNPTIPNEFPLGAPHAHSSVLSIASEHGLPAVVLWLGLMACVLLALYSRSSSRPEVWRTAVSLVASFIAAGMFEHLAGDGESSHAFWTLMGCCLASALDDRSS